MAVGSALTIFVDTSTYRSRIDAINVKLSNLNDIKDEYNQLLNEMKDQVSGEDSDLFENLRKNALNQVALLDSEIKIAQAARDMLQKTVDEMEDNVSSVKNILEDAASAVHNTVETVGNVSETVTEAAIVLSIL